MTTRKIVRGQSVERTKLQRAKELRREMTPAEAILWNVLWTNKIVGYHFRHQQIIAGFIADFYCDAAALVIEVDGAIHQRRREYDAERDTVLSAYDLRILRFTNDEVLRDLAGVLARIREVCTDSSAEH